MGIRTRIHACTIVPELMEYQSSEQLLDSQKVRRYTYSRKPVRIILITIRGITTTHVHRCKYIQYQPMQKKVLKYAPSSQDGVLKHVYLYMRCTVILFYTVTVYVYMHAGVLRGHICSCCVLHSDRLLRPLLSKKKAPPRGLWTVAGN